MHLHVRWKYFVIHLFCGNFFLSFLPLGQLCHVFTFSLVLNFRLSNVFGFCFNFDVRSGFLDDFQRSSSNTLGTCLTLFICLAVPSCFWLFSFFFVSSSLSFSISLSLSNLHVLSLSLWLTHSFSFSISRCLSLTDLLTLSLSHSFSLIFLLVPLTHTHALYSWLSQSPSLSHTYSHMLCPYLTLSFLITWFNSFPSSLPNANNEYYETFIAKNPFKLGHSLQEAHIFDWAHLAGLFIWSCEWVTN